VAAAGTGGCELGPRGDRLVGMALKLMALKLMTLKRMNREKAGLNLATPP
jgi:hypothetical protein